MLRRLPLVLALSLALPTAAHAQDLLQAYEMARTGDRQISISESNRDIAREGRVQARANLLPSVSGSGSIGRSYVAGESGDSRSRTWGVGLQQTVFDLGQVASYQAQRDLDTGAGFDLDAANDELITRTSAAYFDVLVAIETLAAAVAAAPAICASATSEPRARHGSTRSITSTEGMKKSKKSSRRWVQGSPARLPMVMKFNRPGAAVF